MDEYVIAGGLEGEVLTFDDVKGLNKNNRIAYFVGDSIAKKCIDQDDLGLFLQRLVLLFIEVPVARFEVKYVANFATVNMVAIKIRVDGYDMAIVVG